MFNGDDADGVLPQNPAFGFHFMHRVACTLADRLSGTRLQLLEMCGVHLPDVALESD